MCVQPDTVLQSQNQRVLRLAHSEVLRSSSQPIRLRPKEPCLLVWEHSGVVSPHFSGQPAPVPACSLAKEVSINIQPKPSLLQLEAVSSGAAAGSFGEEPNPRFPAGSLGAAVLTMGSAAGTPVSCMLCPALSTEAFYGLAFASKRLAHQSASAQER